MRFAGLSICLLVSTLTARADALEEKVASRDQTVKELERALEQDDSAAQGSSSAAGQGTPKDFSEV